MQSTKKLKLKYKLYKSLARMDKNLVRRLKRLSYGLDGWMVYILDKKDTYFYPTFLFCVVCFDEDKPVGWALVSMFPNGPQYIWSTKLHLDIYVKATYRKKGIGKTLATKARNYFKKQTGNKPFVGEKSVITYCAPDFFYKLFNSWRKRNSRSKH